MLLWIVSLLKPKSYWLSTLCKSAFETMKTGTSDVRSVVQDLARVDGAMRLDVASHAIDECRE